MMAGVKAKNWSHINLEKILIVNNNMKIGGAEKSAQPFMVDSQLI